MQNDLKEYFRPLIVFCTILGLWPASFEDKKKVLNFICILPIHVFFWYSIHHLSVSHAKVQAPGIFIFVDTLFVYIFLLFDVLVLVNNFLIRGKIRNMFEDMRYFENTYLHFVKRRNLKSNIFLFSGFLISIVIQSINMNLIHIDIIFYALSRYLPFYLIFCHIFKISEILYIARNMFCKINKQFTIFNNTHLNINSIIILSKVHYDLTSFTNKQNNIFAVPLMACTAEIFLYMLFMGYNTVSISRKILFGRMSHGILGLCHALLTVQTALAITYLCTSWVFIKKEVSNLITVF